MKQLMIVFVVAAAGRAVCRCPMQRCEGQVYEVPAGCRAPAARCRTAKGAFAKCGTPGAKPA